MKRVIGLAVAALLLGAPAAFSQILGSGSADFNSANPAGTLGQDIMGNMGQDITGIRTRVGSSSNSRLAPMDDPLAARDGCINYPGKAHNSADCSLLNYWDPNWIVPNKPVSEMTGAEENMLRSYNLLHDHPFLFTYKR
jgi:hypothetical protein